MAVLGYAFSTKTFLLAMNNLDPISGLVVYMVVSYSAIYVLSRSDLTIAGWKIKSVTQTIGLFLITFSWYIVVGWSNQYVQYVTQGSFDGASVLFFQCEDGVAWHLMASLIPPSAPFMIWIDRVLAFSVIPFSLTLIGGLLASGKAKLR